MHYHQYKQLRPQSGMNRVPSFLTFSAGKNLSMKLLQFLSVNNKALLMIFQVHDHCHILYSALSSPLPNQNEEGLT